MTTQTIQPQRPRWSGLTLKWEITFAIIIKVVLLWLLWTFFFSAPQARHMRIPEKQVTQHLLANDGLSNFKSVQNSTPNSTSKPVSIHHD